jgi:hypothetical protein
MVLRHGTNYTRTPENTGLKSSSVLNIWDSPKTLIPYLSGVQKGAKKGKKTVKKGRIGEYKKCFDTVTRV